MSRNTDYFKREKAFVKKLEETICLPSFSAGAFAWLLTQTSIQVQYMFMECVLQYTTLMAREGITGSLEENKIIHISQHIERLK